MDRGPQSGKISGLNLEPKRKAFKIHIRSQACPIFFRGRNWVEILYLCVIVQACVFRKIYWNVKQNHQPKCRYIELPPTSRFHQTIAIKFLACSNKLSQICNSMRADKTNIHHSIYLNFRWFCESADLVVFHSIRYVHFTQAKPFISFICGCARLNGKENVSSMYFPFYGKKRLESNTPICWKILNFMSISILLELMFNAWNIDGILYASHFILRRNRPMCWNRFYFTLTIAWHRGENVYIIKWIHRNNEMIAK